MVESGRPGSRTRQGRAASSRRRLQSPRCNVILLLLCSVSARARVCVYEMCVHTLHAVDDGVRDGVTGRTANLRLCVYVCGAYGGRPIPDCRPPAAAPPLTPPPPPPPACHFKRRRHHCFRPNAIWVYTTVASTMTKRTRARIHHTPPTAAVAAYTYIYILCSI